MDKIRNTIAPKQNALGYHSWHNGALGIMETESTALSKWIPTVLYVVLPLIFFIASTFSKISAPLWHTRLSTQPLWSFFFTYIVGLLGLCSYIRLLCTPGTHSNYATANDEYNLLPCLAFLSLWLSPRGRVKCVGGMAWLEPRLRVPHTSPLVDLHQCAAWGISTSLKAVCTGTQFDRRNNWQWH